jgi:predicted DNA-binding protein
MKKSEEKLKKLSDIFSKGESEQSIGAISLLREEQAFTGVIGLLASHYDNTEDVLIRKAIEEFLNDIKDKSVAPEIIAEIKKPLKAGTISMLISSCWQSGLDYTEYISDFTEIFFKGDYLTAIECLTIIEESTNGLSNKKREELLQLVDKHQLSPISEKAALRQELVSILNR